MRKTKLQFKISFSIFLGIVFFFPFKAEAAKLYLAPVEREYYVGNTVIAEVRLDVKDECVNAVKADLSFSKDNLEVVDFSRGNSILSIWVKEPVIEQDLGQISFIGGIPGGFCGVMPGDPGESNLLGRIIFQVRQAISGQGKIGFSDTSEVLLNDGLGTKAELKTSGAAFNILDEIPYQFKDQWADELTQDSILPEPFEIKIYQESLIFEGKYFITFSTTDKQTGLDYYEVAELNLFERIFKIEKWQKGNSPYLLNDQNLRSLIKVKAVDKAGNERMATIMPVFKPKWQDVIWILLFLIGLGIIFRLIKWRK